MQIYVVRLKANKELVSITAASSLDQLTDLIDECTEIENCEYARLPAGGVLWPNKGAAAVPLPITDEDKGEPPAPNPFIGAEFSDCWFEHLYEDKARWRPVLRAVA